MDNLSHTLTGLALSRAGLHKYCPHATLLLIVAANLPDIDMVSMLSTRAANLLVHRGYTHTLIGLPVMAVLSVLVTAAIVRKRLPWTNACLLASIGVASHLLLDWSMSYGMRLLLPFSSAWSYLDIFSLTDWVVVAVLLAAWLWPFLARLVSDEIGARRSTGRGVAIAALVFFVLYGGFRAVLHERAIGQLESRLYPEHEGLVQRVAALPESLNPFEWNGFVETGDAYHLYQVPSFQNFDPGAGSTFYKQEWTADVAAASKTVPFQAMSYFARFPLWQNQRALDPTDTGVVTLTDLRFGQPGRNFFEVFALLDAQHNVRHADFGPGPLATRDRR